MSSYYRDLVEKAAKGYSVDIEGISSAIDELGSERASALGFTSQALFVYLTDACAVGLATCTSALRGKMNDGNADREQFESIIKDAWKDSVFDIKNCKGYKDAILEIDADTDEDDNENREADSTSDASGDSVDTLSDKELIEAWSKETSCKGAVANSVNAIVATLSALYKSGIVSIPQSGILAELGPQRPPLCCIKANQAETAEFWNQKDSGYSVDMLIKRALKESVPGFNATAECDPTTMFPTFEQLMHDDTQCVKLHLMFQSANIVFSGRDNNKNSIRKWVSATKGESSESWLRAHNKNSKGQLAARLLKWKDVEDWYRWVVTCQAYRYFDEAGLKPNQINEDASIIIQQILNRLGKTIHNIVVVSEREMEKDIMQTTELRIVSNSKLDANNICAALNGALNTGVTHTVDASVRDFDENLNIATIAISFGGGASKALFAYQVLGNLIDSGNTISWDNVLLGRTENGAFQFRDFTDSGSDGAGAAHFQYAIYAGSGSGKGNMTLNILAAALASKCHIFYMDCKADSAGALGNIAWREGKEACCFDGIAIQENQFAMPIVDGMDQPFENHPVLNGVRQPNESKMNLPAVFSKYFTAQDADKFLGVCRYIRAIELGGAMIEARCQGIIPMDNWAVIVFDELTKIANAELDISRLFYTRLCKTCGNVIEGKESTGIKGFKIQHKEWKDAYKQNELLQFVYKWYTWAQGTFGAYKQALASSLRNSKTTLFLIFQNAKWLSEDAGVYTAIGKFVTLFGNNCYKIVGKGFNAKNCDNYGDGNLKDKEWMSKVGGDAESDKNASKGAGFWAISNGPDIRQGQPKLFKPYSIWGYPKPGKEGENVENFFSYYIDMLRAAGDFDPASVLQDAFDYADNAARVIGERGKIVSNTGIKDFIYNASTFSENIEGFDEDQYKKAEGDASETGTYDLGSDLAGGSAYENIDTAHNIGRESEEPIRSADVNTPADDFGSAYSDIDDIIEDPYAEDEEIATGEEFSSIDVEEDDATNVDYLDDDDTAEFDSDDLFGSSEPVGDNADEPLYGTEFRPISRISKQETVTVDKAGRTRIDTSSVIERNHVSRLDTDPNKGNCVRCYGTKDDVRVYMRAYRAAQESDRKYEKFLNKSMKQIMYDIADGVGGRMSVEVMSISRDRILVNNRLVTHPLFRAISENPTVDLIDFGELLGYFTNIKKLTLDTTMESVLEEQIGPCIGQKDVDEGVKDAMDYVLRHRPKLNTITVIDTTTGSKIDERKKADLLEAQRRERIALMHERENRKAEKELSAHMGSVRKSRGMKNVPRKTYNSKAAGKKILKGTGRVVRGLGRGVRGIFKFMWKLGGAI